LKIPNYVIFAAMATKSKKTPAKTSRNGKKKIDGKGWKQEKEENIDWRKLARDERTWKITGAVSLLASIFLFIAFMSYFFTWREDQDKVFRTGAGILVNNDIHVSNLLGRLGAYISHFFVYKGFGIAALLFCTFFFVVGVNLLFSRKVFSIWRNLKYVTIGLLVLSVSLAFLFGGGNDQFPFGGGVGNMISKWLTGIFGTVGTAALLFLVALGYIIWQFNPAFNLPERKKAAAPPVAVPGDETSGEEIEEEEEEDDAKLFIPVTKGNKLKPGDKTISIEPEEELPLHNLQMIEKEEDDLGDIPLSMEKEIVNDLFHRHEQVEINDRSYKEEPVEEEPEPEPEITKPAASGLELEIKTVTDAVPSEEEEKIIENLPPYEPTLDLRDYKYPGLNLLETHGSEKIIQDPAELETNKNQIIATLRNYSIEIQKISATVGPTVTLYEIVPAAGVRISHLALRRWESVSLHRSRVKERSV
jgi:S-DNA-T family DNA segregation ATPase FtsK/SpoIIIE